MRPILVLFLGLIFLTFDAFAEPAPRQLAGALTLSDLRPMVTVKPTDKEAIDKKMSHPARMPDSAPRPRVANTPVNNTSVSNSAPGPTTFGVSIAR